LVSILNRLGIPLKRMGTKEVLTGMTTNSIKIIRTGGRKIRRQEVRPTIITKTLEGTTHLRTSKEGRIPTESRLITLSLLIKIAGSRLNIQLTGRTQDIVIRLPTVVMAIKTPISLPAPQYSFAKYCSAYSSAE
jgi:hypothetical protein